MLKGRQQCCWGGMGGTLDSAIGTSFFQCPGTIPKGPGKEFVDASALPGIEQGTFTLFHPSDPLENCREHSWEQEGTRLLKAALLQPYKGPVQTSGQIEKKKKKKEPVRR